MEHLMKRTVTWIFLLSLALAPITQAIAALEIFTIDPQHSYVLWHINHFGFSNPSGKWMVHGTLDLDKSQPQNSKVDVTIHVAEMITGIPELDKHLKTKLFFDTAKFPAATFTSDRISMTGKKTAKIYGNLTIRGITKPIVLDATLNKVGPNPISNKMSVGFSATTQLKRTDFDINTLSPGLGDEVKINIELEAYKKAS